MKEPVDLSPLGTAREAIDGNCPTRSPDSSAAREQDLLCWYRKIRGPLKSLYNVEDEVGLIAWDLTRCQVGLGLIDQQALMLLILTILVHLRQGSTRIPLRGPEGVAIRLDLASRLLKGIEPIPGTA